MRNFTIGEKILPLVRRYNLDKGLFLSLIMIASFFVTTPLKAQAVVDIFNLPEPERCTSNDLRVVEASLDFDQCGPTCEEGEVIEYPLTLAIFNNTGSLRTSFAFYSRLEQYDSEGNLTNTYFITGCRGPVPPNTTTEITFDESLVILDENGDPTSFEGVPYLCGGSLKLINLYEAWTDASDNDNRQCPLDPSKINPKCGVLQSIEIQTPLSAFVESTADVTCFGSADGSIDITVAGGEEPYTFVWTRDGNGFSASTEDLVNIPAGTYNVTVTDSQGCSETLEDIIVGSPDVLDADVDSDDVTCFEGSDGSITITNPSGGSGNYEFSIDGGSSWQASGSFTGLSADTYSVFIRDADNTDCFIDLGDEVIDEPDILDADVDSENVSCFEGSDGSITITNPSGGSGNFEYSINGGSSWQASGSFTGLSAGDYDIFIRDANTPDCEIDLGDVTITQPDELEVSLVDITDATCDGFENGAIDISVTGGTPPYTYVWSNGDTTQDLSEVGAGTYSVTVTDDNGCSDTLENLEIGDPSSLEAEATTITDVSCFGFEDGAIDITVSGGTPPYTYVWSNGETTQDVSGLDADTYSVTITDDNGCERTLTGLTVGEPEQVPAPTVEIAPADCFPTNGSFIITSPTEGFEFSLDDGDWFTYTGTISDVPAGSHTLVVRDATSECESEPLIFDIPEPFEVPVAPTLSAVQPDCDTLQGSIIVTSGTEGFLFSINGGEFVSYPTGFSGLAPGDYTVQARSLDGCVSDFSFITLEEPECVVDEGCTLGYWKNHTDRWCDAYATCDRYGDIFTSAPSSIADLSLLEVLNLGGGGIYNLARQSVAALLNTCSSEVDFAYSNVESLISDVNEAFTNGEAGSFGTYLDGLNMAGCPLGGSSATTAPTSPECDATAATLAPSGFSVSPVPFVDQISVQYHFNYVSNVNIQFFNLSGQMLQSFKFRGVTAGNISDLNVGAFVRSSQAYIIKVNTDRESFSKTIISSE